MYFLASSSFLFILHHRYHLSLLCCSILLVFETPPKIRFQSTSSFCSFIVFRLVRLCMWPWILPYHVKTYYCIDPIVAIKLRLRKPSWRKKLKIKSEANFCLVWSVTTRALDWLHATSRFVWVDIIIHRHRLRSDLILDSGNPNPETKTKSPPPPPPPPLSLLSLPWSRDSQP